MKYIGYPRQLPNQTAQLREAAEKLINTLRESEEYKMGDWVGIESRILDIKEAVRALGSVPKLRWAWRKQNHLDPDYNSAIQGSYMILESMEEL